MHRRVVLVAALVASCGTKAPPPASADAAAQSATTPDAVTQSVQSALDADADPCQDFYQYACGGWLDGFELPADRPIYARSFSAISDHNQEVVRSILESGTGDPRLGAYFQACTDTAAIDAEGTAALAGDLARIDAAKNVEALVAMLGKLPLADAFVGGFVEADFGNPDMNTFHVAQGGTALPERNYYFPEDDEGRALLADYKAHVGRMLALAGRDPAGADAVLEIETKLAKASKAPAELREVDKLYHPTAVADLPKLAGKVPWKAMLDGLGLADVGTINVMTPDFFPALGAVLRNTPLDKLKAYTAWQLIHGAAPYLSSEIDAEHFAFWSTRLAGQTEQQPRWKRCVQRTDGALGDLLGRAFVDQAFAGDSKAKALAMVDDLRKAFDMGLPELAWMDEPTRAAAKAKLDAITEKIGYPDKWETYEGLELPGGHYANVVAASLWNIQDQLKDVNKPVDKTDWGMSPPTVNAYYNPLANEIAFPAGILQPPFFSADYPTAMNYGAIGMVIGHEITHGFDDEGRKFGPSGKLEVWWDEAVAERFETQAQCIRDTYASIEVQPGLSINGELTAGENIADFGGIKLATRAYGLWKQAGGTDRSVAGLSPEQMLFVGYAQSWCSKATPEVEKLRLRSDSHSPPKYRVNVPLAHLPAFWEAFDCPVGTPMHPESTCEVW